jgi:hypothetical protein
MWDFLELLLQVVLEGAGACCSWRFWVSVVATLALVTAIYWAMPNSALAIAVAIPVVVVGLILGFVWDRGT